MIGFLRKAGMIGQIESIGKLGCATTKLDGSVSRHRFVLFSAVIYTIVTNINQRIWHLCWVCVSFLKSCGESETTRERIFKRVEGERDGCHLREHEGTITNRRTEKQTYIQHDKQTCRKTDILTDRHTTHFYSLFTNFIYILFSWSCCCCNCSTTKNTFFLPLEWEETDEEEQFNNTAVHPPPTPPSAAPPCVSRMDVYP